MKGVRATEWESVLVPGDGAPVMGTTATATWVAAARSAGTRRSTTASVVAIGARLRLADTDVEHGSYSTYINYKCRCVACKRANADYARAYNARRKGGAA